MDEISSSWPTIFELASQIPKVDLTRSASRGGSKISVVQGLSVEPFPVKEGYFEVTPQQLASLRVPKIEVGTEVRGFQREKINAHARKIARAMLAGDEMPPIFISIFPDGNVYVDDGQHRALGAVIARKPLEVIVKRRTLEEARKLFTNQSKAKNLRSDDTLLTGDTPIELYIQDALTSDNHPWSKLVSATKNGNYMTPTTMAIIVGSYTLNTMSQGVNYITRRSTEEWDEKSANELSTLVSSFGNHQTNPMAFRGRSLRAITFAAIFILRRWDPAPGDFDRWQRHMPKFEFGKYPHLLNRETDLAVALVDHWNKFLKDERRVQILTYR